MKKLIAMCLLVLAMYVGNASDTYTFETNGYTISYSVYNGKATISSDGWYGPAISPTPTGEFVIPDSINGYRVTAIGEMAFVNCSELTRVQIPESVDRICEGAFEQCTSLQRVNFPSNLVYLGNAAFENCRSLGSAVIPSSVTSLGYGVFYGCVGLTNVEVYCFSDYWIESFCRSRCQNVTRLIIPGSKSRYGGYRGDYLRQCFPNVKELEFIAGTASVPYGMCSRMESLESVVLPDGVKIIGEMAFSDCASLTNVVAKGVIEEIGYAAFAGCAKLQGLVFQEGLKTIGNYAFAECENLIDFNIPSSVTSLGRNIFEGCKKMKMDLVIPGSMRWIESDAFSGMEGITSVTIGEGVYEIGWESFSGCSGITNVALPNSLHSIGPRAFYGCTSLPEITIPSNVYDVASMAFENCTNLQSVTILSERVWMYSWMFYGCPNLTNLSITANSRYGRFQWYLYGRNQNLTLNILPGATLLTDYYLGNINGVSALNLPEGLESIGRYSVAYCYNLEKVSFPSTLTSIGDYALYNCNRLEQIELPDGLVSIGQYAFAQTDLAGVSIPASVEHIGLRAFGDLDVTNIAIDSACENYAIEGGVLYRIDNDVKTELMQATTSLSGHFIVPSTVTNVYSYAFRGCDQLVSVRLPEGIKQIRGWLFSGCKNLKNVYVPVSVDVVDSTAFRDLDFSVLQFENEDFYVDGSFIFHKLQDEELELVGVESCFEGILDFADRVVSVAPSACRNCKSMGGVIFNEFVTNIGFYAFSGCTNITSLTIPSTISAMGRNSFAYCYNLKNVSIGSAYIGEYAFYQCGGLSSVDISDSVKTIGSYTFSYCTNLSDITLPATVSKIGDNAFYRCDRLGFASIGGGDVGRYAFEYCRGLTNLLLGAGVTGIGEYAFGSCTNLSSHISVPLGVSEIGDNAFYNCERIPSVSVATERIGNYAFENCDALSQIDFIEGVKRIGQYSFAYCTNVHAIALPKTVNEISSGAFSGCSMVTNVTFAGNAPTADSWAFNGVAKSCEVFVRNGSIGWDDDGDGKWNGMAIVYYGVADPIPELDVSASSSYVAAALLGSRDENLIANITNAATYNAYREWAESVRGSNDAARAGRQAVRDAPNAWLSFALNATSLIGSEPKEDDVKIEEFKSRGESGRFDFTVSLDGVHVGSAAQKENLKKIFGLEGGRSLKSLSSENVDISFETPVAGKVKFTAGPKDANAKAFFMKVKLNP